MYLPLHRNIKSRGVHSNGGQHLTRVIHWTYNYYDYDYNKASKEAFTTDSFVGAIVTVFKSVASLEDFNALSAGTLELI